MENHCAIKKNKKIYTNMISSTIFYNRLKTTKNTSASSFVKAGKRNSSVELLRIIAMLLIIMGHYSSHGGIDKLDLILQNSPNGFFLQVISTGSIGVNIFVLIYGYYAINSSFNLKRLMKLLLQVWFFSVLIYAVFVALGIENFSLFTALTVFFPTICNQYWFFTAYIVIMLLSPFLNKGLKALSEKEMRVLIIIMLIIWSVIPMFSYNAMFSNEFIGFFMVYCIGAYMRLHVNKTEKTVRMFLMTMVISGTLLVLSVLVLGLLGINVHVVFAEMASVFYCQNSILNIGFSVGISGVFFFQKQYCNRFVNRLAALTFGIYLIHDNNFVRSILWSDILHNEHWANSPLIAVHMFTSVVAIFAACGIIEWLRQIVLERNYMKVVGPAIERIDNSRR